MVYPGVRGGGKLDIFVKPFDGPGAAVDGG